jgi:sorting nexin-4
MEYVRGDRFGSDFTSRRAHSLQRFLTRLALHPELRKAPILHIFLESHDWNATMRSTGTRSTRGLSGASPTSEVAPPGSGGNGGVFDAFTDSFINAFTKVHKPDRRFIEVKERSDKLDEDLAHVEKVMVRVARRESDLEADLRDLAEQFQKLIVLEPGVDAATHAFAASVEDSAAGLKRLQHHTEADYVGSLRDMAAYSQALKNLLKLREQKQLDYEQLTEYLNKSTAERDAGAGGSGSGSGSYGGGSYGGYSVTGAGGFIRSKIEDVRGVDHEQSRRDRQRKLELRIDELTREVESARTEADHFADQVVHETQNFEWIKRVEFRRQFGGLADAHIQFYDGIAHTWERYVLEMEREGMVLPS